MLERGVRMPRLDTIVKVAGGLEIEAGVLFEGLEWTPGSSIPWRIQRAATTRGRAASRLGGGMS
jgi:hypothetical protein